MGSKLTEEERIFLKQKLQKLNKYKENDFDMYCYILENYKHLKMKNI